MGKFGKNLDNKICKKASEFEKNIIKSVKNSKARAYFKNKFSDRIEKKKFDDCFKSIEEASKKGKDFLESQNVKDKCKKIDKYLIKMANSNKTDKVINFIDNFNTKMGHKFLEEAEKFSNLLDLETKEQFRDNAKELIQEEINLCYENYLEEGLKELVINTCRMILDSVDERMNKNKKKKNK